MLVGLVKTWCQDALRAVVGDAEELQQILAFEILLDVGRSLACRGVFLFRGVICCDLINVFLHHPTTLDVLGEEQHTIFTITLLTGVLRPLRISAGGGGGRLNRWACASLWNGCLCL
eukprot:TRINITY_DN49505_c0_g1_i1.p3 TRINITY_DN49505_c0_g1~~TRINITY_DN49505_c0_g1_i1.p3  ORF type:complete len:117 (-),score=19.47 TRINITY_DN49505_c0_g1_i1:165-515(-)